MNIRDIQAATDDAFLAACDAGILRGMVTGIAAAFAVATLDGRIVHASAELLADFALRTDGGRAAMLADLFHAADAGEGAAAVAGLAASDGRPGAAQRTVQGGGQGAAQAVVHSYRGLHSCRGAGDGAPVTVALTGRLLRDAMGRPVFVILTLQAIADDLRHRAALEEVETRWQFALDIARQGLWDHDATTGRTYHSPMWREIRGMSPTEPIDPTREAWLSGVHPEDMDRVLAQVDRQEQGEPGFETLEYRQRHRAGHYVWLRSHGRPVSRDAQGRTLRIIGTDTDITPLKDLEAALVAERERARAFLAAVADAAICVDARRRVVMMNRVAEDWTGWPLAEAEGRPLAEVLNLGPDDALPSLVDACIAETEQRMLDGDARLGSRNGALREIRATAAPLFAGPRGSGGAPAEATGAVLVLKDVTVSRLLVRQLSHEASHDLLTGLLNRASFEGALEAAQATCAEGGHAILFMDLIEFKAVNDRLGRAAGDRLLTRVAGTIRSCVRRGDVCARYGGDEFAILLHGCGPEGAHGLRSEIARAVGALEVPGRNEGIGIAIGVGLMDATTSGRSALDAALAAAAAARGPRRKRG